MKTLVGALGPISEFAAAAMPPRVAAASPRHPVFPGRPPLLSTDRTNTTKESK
jgi:hypothetical protein